MKLIHLPYVLILILLVILSLNYFLSKQLIIISENNNANANNSEIKYLERNLEYSYIKDEIGLPISKNKNGNY